MAPCQRAARPLIECLRITQSSNPSSRTIRAFATTARSNEATQVVTDTVSPMFDPNTVTSIKGERALMQTGVMPIGSRRRRAAVKSSDNIPFEQLPYQCFQEARKVLMADREEKLDLIRKTRTRINTLINADYSDRPNLEQSRPVRLVAMQRQLELLKIQADINDPLIKKRFEDGEGLLL